MSGQLRGLVLFIVVGVTLAVAVLLASTIGVLREAVGRRMGGATQIAVRMSFAVMVAFAALAQVFRPEAILGAFLAGIAVSAISHRTAGTGATRGKLEVVGSGCWHRCSSSPRVCGSTSAYSPETALSSCRCC